jgi:hypothetical protein
MNASRCLRRDGYRFTAQHKAWLPGVGHSAPADRSVASGGSLRGRGTAMPYRRTWCLEFLTNPVDFYLPKRSGASCQSPWIVRPPALVAPFGEHRKEREDEAAAPSSRRVPGQIPAIILRFLTPVSMKSRFAPCLVDGVARSRVRSSAEKRNSGSHRTPRWREGDSNPWSHSVRSNEAPRQV